MNDRIAGFGGRDAATLADPTTTLHNGAANLTPASGLLPKGSAVTAWVAGLGFGLPRISTASTLKRAAGRRARHDRRGRATCRW